MTSTFKKKSSNFLLAINFLQANIFYGIVKRTRSHKIFQHTEV